MRSAISGLNPVAVAASEVTTFKVTALGVTAVNFEMTGAGLTDSEMTGTDYGTSAMTASTLTASEVTVLDDSGVTEVSLTASTATAADSAVSETDTAVWAALFLLSVCFMESEEDHELYSTRKGGQGGHCRQIQVVQVSAKPCGGADSWRSSRNPEFLVAPFPTVAVIPTEVKRAFKGRIMIHKENWMKDRTSRPCWRRDHSPHWRSLLSWAVAGGITLMLILLGPMLTSSVTDLQERRRMSSEHTKFK